MISEKRAARTWSEAGRAAVSDPIMLVKRWVAEGYPGNG